MTNSNRAKRACFAIAAKLFSEQDLFWEFIKRSFDVNSRSDLSERDWVKIEARLRAAENFSSCRDALFYEVEKEKLECSDLS